MCCCQLQPELNQWLLQNQFRSFPSTMDYHVHTCSRSVMSDLFAIPWTVVCQAPLSRSFPGKNTGVWCHFLLQGIFPTRGRSEPSSLESFPLAGGFLPLVMSGKPHGLPECYPKYQFSGDEKLTSECESRPASFIKRVSL